MLFFSYDKTLVPSLGHFGGDSLWSVLNLGASVEAACGVPALHFHVLQTLATAPQGKLRLQELAEGRPPQSKRGRPGSLTAWRKRVWSFEFRARRIVEWSGRFFLRRAKEIYDQACPVWEGFLHDHLLKGLSADEAETLRSLLLKLQGTLSRDTPSCPSLLVNS